MAWIREDLLNFQSLQPDAVVDDSASKDDVYANVKKEDPELGNDDTRFANESHINAAQKVSDMARHIEETFFLPRGCVWMLYPDRSPVLGHTKIDTLRKRWETNYKNKGNKRLVWQQGNLDGLCGLYSCVNAVYSCVDNMSIEDCQELFNIGIEYLAENRMLKNAILEGISR